MITFLIYIYIILYFFIKINMLSWGSGQSFLSSFIIYSLRWPQYIFYIRRYNILLRPLARLYIIPDYSIYNIITYIFIHILCHTLLLRVCVAGSGPREEFSYWLPQVIIIIKVRYIQPNGCPEVASHFLYRCFIIKAS